MPAAGPEPPYAARPEPARTERAEHSRTERAEHSGSAASADLAPRSRQSHRTPRVEPGAIGGPRADEPRADGI